MNGPNLDGSNYLIYEPIDEKLLPKESGSKALTGLVHEPFSFVAGCCCGDDTSWKVEYLDLSQADKGILKREDRFGYIEVPREMTLRDAIDMGDGEGSIRIAHEETFNLKTGKRYDYPLDTVSAILKGGGLGKDGQNGAIDPSKTYGLVMGGKDYQSLIDIVKDR